MKIFVDIRGNQFLKLLLVGVLHVALVLWH